MKLTEATAKELKEYLLSHERDIADAENDFDELYDLFCEVFGREPKE